MKSVFIIAIVAVAMIGVMVPSVFAQIEVTVTPHKESNYIDELNWVTVELSKVVPNTNLCYENIQNNVINPKIEHGNYQVRVFYGECNTENSFGNGYATIMYKNEVSPVTKFMQDNYFPERIDVGIDYQKEELFTYDRSFYHGCIDHGGDRNFCGISNVVSQTWNRSNNIDKMTIIIGYVENRIDDNSKHLTDLGHEYDEFMCYGDHVRHCFSDSVVVKIIADGGRMFIPDRREKSEQIDIWMPIILEKISSNPIPSQSKLSSMYSTQSVDTTTSLDPWSGLTATSNSEDSLSIKNNECGKGTFLKNDVCVVELTCGKGTMEKNGQCVVDNSSKGGGCLIATATYGSEMANEVQQLRELRDNQLLNTESGTVFMSTFNDIYYSFSPTIADMEREHPMFKEAVKLAITPMISTLSLMENAESESEVLSIGISVIVLNLGMYLGVPAVVIIGIRKRF
jgi:hypothetical protein